MVQPVLTICSHQLQSPHTEMYPSCFIHVWPRLVRSTNWHWAYLAHASLELTRSWTSHSGPPQTFQTN